MKLIFRTGFPRAGGTLLDAILVQNPDFRADGLSPLSAQFKAQEIATSRRGEAGALVSDDQRLNGLRGLFASHYGDDHRVVVDSGRLWAARLPLLVKLFPDCKMIAMVREVGWVLDSFERLYRRNGMQPSAVYSWSNEGTVYWRTAQLAEPSGPVGYAINAVREAWYSEEAKGRILLLDYETLCRDPEKTMASVYDFLGEPKFQHDFERVSYQADEFDRALGADGMHRVSGPVVWQPRKTVLPPDLFAQYNGPNFWREPNFRAPN